MHTLENRERGTNTTWKTREYFTFINSSYFGLQPGTTHSVYAETKETTCVSANHSVTRITNNRQWAICLKGLVGEANENKKKTKLIAIVSLFSCHHASSWTGWTSRNLGARFCKCWSTWVTLQRRAVILNSTVSRVSIWGTHLAAIPVVSEPLTVFNALILTTSLRDTAVRLSPLCKWGVEAEKLSDLPKVTKKFSVVLATEQILSESCP